MRCCREPSPDYATRSGTAAVINIDGHLDLYDAKTSPTGEGADVPISTLLGLGVPAWSQTLGPEPVLTPANVALVGHRDFDEAKSLGSTMPEDAGITGSWDVEAVRQSPSDTADAVLQHLDPTPYWVHLDLDVLDEAVLPATDYLMPGGLTWSLLGELLDPLVHGAGFRGLSLACLNPEKDPGRTVRAGRRQHPRRGTQLTGHADAGARWQRGQKYDDRLVNATRRICAPQREQSWPSRSYDLQRTLEVTALTVHVHVEAVERRAALT